jgi:hypothetical protein
MKVFLSISFACLLILSGMHLSYARHYCGGEVAATHWSFSGVKASCDMEMTSPVCPEHQSISSECCANEMMTFSVDDSYNPSTFQVKSLIQKLLQVYFIPLKVFFDAFQPVNTNKTDVAPPGIALTSAVSLENICIFRI